jgi:hypothetical protein
LDAGAGDGRPRLIIRVVTTRDDLLVAAGPSVDPGRWAGIFDELMTRAGARFSRVEPRRRARAFVLGLLAELPRKNCWTIAEHAGDRAPDGMQHLLSRARWDADGVDDRHRREQARDDRQADGGAHADQAHQDDRQERPADRAEVVHRPLEPVRPPVYLGRHDVGEQGVTRGHPQAPRGPGPGPQDPGLPRRGSGSDRSGKHRGRGVSAHCDPAAAAWIIGQRAACEIGQSRGTIRDALDQAQRRRRSMQDRGQQGWQQRCRNLVTQVGQ